MSGCVRRHAATKASVAKFFFSFVSVHGFGDIPNRPANGEQMGQPIIRRAAAKPNRSQSIRSKTVTAVAAAAYSPMSPVFEALLAAAAAKPVVTTLGGGGLVVILLKGWNSLMNIDFKKLPEEMTKFCDGIVSFQDSKDRAVGNSDRRIRCSHPDCGEMVRRSNMAEHLQNHIEIIKRSKILSDLLAVRDMVPLGNEAVGTEAMGSEAVGTEAMGSEAVGTEAIEELMANLRAKEAEALAKDKSKFLENKERKRKGKRAQAVRS